MPQKAYLSTISPRWPIERQHSILDLPVGTTTVYQDRVKLRRGQDLKPELLKDRAELLRPTARRNGSESIFVASLAVLAVNADDLNVVLAQAAERGATIRDVHAKL